MELEKIVSTVLGKVGNTDVSPETVKTLISLKPVADGAEPDDAYFEEIAKAVKSVQGNVNNVFSTKLKEQVDSKVEEYKKAHPNKEKPEEKPSDKDMPEWAKQMKAELDQERAERQKEKTERERKNLIDSVKSGLRNKYKDAGLEMNEFFLDTALSKLSIPEKDADVKVLVDDLEKLYNADRKKAGMEHDAPRAGNGGGGSKDDDDEHLFDDIKKRRARYNPNPDKK